MFTGLSGVTNPFHLGAVAEKLLARRRKIFVVLGILARVLLVP
jgi:hypothetical protein